MKSSRVKTDVATILNHQSHRLEHLTANSWQQRTLHAIRHCRTAIMGGHIDKCDNPKCNKLHLSYNSCRNRHCPKCQGHLREKWIQAREEELLPVRYFHVVFTLPSELNSYALHQPKELYDSLFKSAWQTMEGFAGNPKFLGAKTGMIAILHTWGQNISLHPHLHCIVPAGGLTKQGRWKATRGKGKYLFDVKAMSKVFRSKFMACLKSKVEVSRDLSSQVYKKKWVVYAKQPFYGPQQVVEYLGRYTHKIAISNSRITKIEDGKVCFTMKDYRDGKNKLCKLTEAEFIRRFSQHILPKGYVRIRHYGIISSGKKLKTKAQVEYQEGKTSSITKKQPLIYLGRCPCCKKGRLVTIAIFDNRGPPKHWIQRINQQ